MTRLLNLLLVIAIVIGLVMLAQQRHELNETRRERDRLGKVYGILEVEDPESFYIARIETGDSQHFLWRVYCPAKLRIEHRLSMGGDGRFTKGASTNSNPGEFLFRCRFTFEDTSLHTHLMDRGGGGRSTLSDPELTSFLRDHWDELEFEFLEDGEVSADSVLHLVTIRMPEPLLNEFIQQVPQHRLAKKLADEPLFQMTYGTSAAFSKAEANVSGGEL